jgi:dephospho-CoA kinase
LVGPTAPPRLGKSEAQSSGRLWRGVISADKIGHSILDTNAKVRAKYKKMFGHPRLIHGRPNREFIGRRVFANPNFWLNSMLSFIRSFVRLLKKEQTWSPKAKKIIVVDAALIFEWCIADWFDIILVIDAAREIRKKR